MTPRWRVSGQPSDLRYFFSTTMCHTLFFYLTCNVVSMRHEDCRWSPEPLQQTHMCVICVRWQARQWSARHGWAWYPGSHQCRKAHLTAPQHLHAWGPSHPTAGVKWSIFNVTEYPLIFTWLGSSRWKGSEDTHKLLRWSWKNFFISIMVLNYD